MTYGKSKAQFRHAMNKWRFDQMRRATDIDSSRRGDEALTQPTFLAANHQQPTTNHTCAVPGCDRRIRPEYLMCLQHWRKVSPHTQRAVYATWRAYSANKAPADGARYRAARARAIAEAELNTDH